MEICKMLTLSTLHISQETMQFLEEAVESGEVICYEKEDYGFWIYCGVPYIGRHIPEDLRQLINLTIENDCLWLCLDEDGTIEQNLPKYAGG